MSFLALFQNFTICLDALQVIDTTRGQIEPSQILNTGPC